MNPQGVKTQAGGMFLVQALVYMAILATLCFLAFDFFFSLSAGARRVRSAGEDIVRTMNVGERWRSDVREAGTIAEGGDSLRLGGVVYSLEDGTVTRTAEGRRVTVLPKVVGSRFVRDERSAVIAWRWEVELEKPDPGSNMKPLFTFIAVNGREDVE